MTLVNCFLKQLFSIRDVMPIVSQKLLGRHIINAEDVFIVEAVAVSQTDVIVLYVKRDQTDGEACPIGDRLFGYEVSIVVHPSKPDGDDFLMGIG